MESWVQTRWPRANSSDLSIPYLSKVLRLLGSSEAKSYEVPQRLRKIISAKRTIWCSKMQCLSLVLRLPRDMHLCRPSRFAHSWQGEETALQRPKCSENAVFRTSTQLPKLNFQKVLRTHQLFTSLNLKCVSRQNGVQFFISHLPRPLLRATLQSHKALKNRVSCDFSTFSRTSIFLLLLLLLAALLFSDSSHLCFSTCPYCQLSEAWLLEFLLFLSNCPLEYASQWFCLKMKHFQILRFVVLKVPYCIRIAM